MTRRFLRCALAGLPMACLLLGAPQPVSATIVFDDHFDGNSGGMPAGWHLLFGPGTVVESGTTVLFTNDVVIASDGVFDPTQGEVTLATEFALLSGTTGGMMGLVDGNITHAIVALVHSPDGMLKVVAIDEGGEQHYYPGYLSAYAGGPIRMTLALGPASFCLSTDDPPFSTGPIDYASVFPTFTRDDLDTASHVCVGNDSIEELDTDLCGVDRVTMEVELPTPVERSTLGRIKALFRR